MLRNDYTLICYSWEVYLYVYFLLDKFDKSVSQAIYRMFLGPLHKNFILRFPNTWTHGDYIKVNSKTGGITMLGRSDGTLNPSGVRFGSSEVYSVGKYNKSNFET